MNFLILGDGPEERSWAVDLSDRPGHRVVAAAPGFAELSPGIATLGDLDAALAFDGVEAVVVGGSLDFRDESLRRSAAAGFATIALHPPGPNADAYYQVSLSRGETGAVVVPDLPGRLHPGVQALREALAGGTMGRYRGLKIEANGETGDPDLVLGGFARWADLVRLLLGEVVSLSALGDPPGGPATEGLTVQLRGRSARPADLRLSSSGSANSVRITLMGESTTLTLVLDRGWDGPSRLIRSTSAGEETTVFPNWDARGAILGTLAEAIAGRPSRPNLHDGTRAMELASAVARSLRRGRSVDLHYEEVSEAGNFKTIMTSTGCMLLLGILVALPAALVGPALGLGQTIYIAYAIPPILILFAALQSLRIVVKPTPAPGLEDEVEPA